jgi:hypothetical protein
MRPPLGGPYNHGMADDPPKLSQQELALVLQRAAERETREGPRSFSPEEVVQAGRELGLAPGTVEAELKALVARKATAAVRERPFDTRVKLESTPDRFVLRVPPRGLHGAAVVKLGFSVFWLGFVGFWTRSALSAGAPPLFSLFSIPFWLVGVGLLGGAIRSIIGGERLELDRESGSLSRSPGGLVKKIQTRELRVRLDRVRRRQAGPADTQETPVVTLEHGTRTFTLLEGFSDAEQRWVKAELEAWLDG